MATSTSNFRYLILATGLLVLSGFCRQSAAQQGGFEIGGRDGIVIGGGDGLRIGGPNGVQFGGGKGAKFGGPNGVQFGGGKGAKFGGPDGVQFGGGAGAKFGPLQVGGQKKTDDPKATSDKRNRPITLRYPKGAKEPLDFTLNDMQFTVHPGETIELRRDRRWIIQFPGGNGHGDHRYSLAPGDYTFEQTPNGWNLFRDAPERPSAPTPPPAKKENTSSSQPH